MKKAINVLKKAVRWYFEQGAKTYAWVPTGVIPKGE